MFAPTWFAPAWYAPAWFATGSVTTPITPAPTPTPTPTVVSASWGSASLLEKFQMYLGRGNGGVMVADELWTDPRCYLWLADAQENVYADLAPICPAAFMLPPVALVSTDGGVTYTIPGGAYPFGHTEVYAQESGGRPLFATTYANGAGDFVIEGIRIRAPGNRTRTYQSGPYARYVGMPEAISATVEPSLQPAAARELILFKALANAADVSEGAMDNKPWLDRYANARMRWITVWQTQYAGRGMAARGVPSSPWWLALDAFNGAGS